MLINDKIFSIQKSVTQSPSLLRSLTPKTPITHSKPALLLPTCLFMSPNTSIFSTWILIQYILQIIIKSFFFLIWSSLLWCINLEDCHLSMLQLKCNLHYSFVYTCHICNTRSIFWVHNHSYFVHFIVSATPHHLIIKMYYFPHTFQQSTFADTKHFQISLSLKCQFLLPIPLL